MRKRRYCENCAKPFIPANGRQIYCGAVKREIGCSYLVHRRKQLERYYKNRESLNAQHKEYYKKNKISLREVRRKYARYYRLEVLGIPLRSSYQAYFYSK